VQTADIEFLRSVHCVALVRSCENRKTLNFQPLCGIERSQLRWFDHTSKMSQEGLLRQVLLATPTANRSRGRSSTRWSDYISNLACSHLGVEPAERSEIDIDCEVFRVPLDQLCRYPPPEEKLAGKLMNECPTFLKHHPCICPQHVWTVGKLYNTTSIRFY